MIHKMIVEPISLTKFGLVCTCLFSAVGNQAQIQKVRSPTSIFHRAHKEKVEFK